MLIVDDQQIKPHVLFATGQTVWADALCTQLNEGDYHITATEQADSLAHYFDHLTIDAVLASATPSIISLLEDLRHHYPGVLVVLIVPEDAEVFMDDHILSLVDVAVPPTPAYIDQQLELLLRYRLENERLQQQIEQLEDEVAQQRHLTNEVELLKNAIVRNVSHELRTPLLQVKSAVSLIAEDTDDQKLVTYAKNATARLETHVKNITMLGNSLDMRPSPIILRDAIEYARRNLGRVWQRKDELNRIQVKIEPNLPPLFADKQGLSTVLQLLVDNALKFSDDEIIIRAQRRQDIVRVDVQDWGIGIAEDKLQAIFDTFYQVDSSSTRRYGGAGVGLAIVKLILDKHDTSIHVESTIDEGSTFWFELPLLDMSDL